MARAPQLPWGRILVLGVIAALLALIGLEVVLARWGVEPSLRNKPSYWANELERALAHPDGRAVLLIGSSRIQNGLDPELLSSQVGAPTFNISLSGAGSLEILQHVAYETNYRGVVLLELWPVTDLSEQGAASSKARRFIEHSRARPPLDRVESRLESWVEGSLRLLHPGLNSLKILRMFVNRRQVLFPIETFNARRFSGNAFDRLPAPRLRELRQQYERWTQAKSPAPDVRASFEPYAKSIRKLQERGARVLVFHPRMSGPAMEREDALWPREQVWDALLAPLGVASLHYQDEPALMAMTCPDHVHINQSDTAVMTKVVASRLKPLLDVQAPSAPLRE